MESKSQEDGVDYTKAADKLWMAYRKYGAFIDGGVINFYVSKPHPRLCSGVLLSLIKSVP